MTTNETHGSKDIWHDRKLDQPTIEIDGQQAVYHPVHRDGMGRLMVAVAIYNDGTGLSFDVCPAEPPLDLEPRRLGRTLIEDIVAQLKNQVGWPEQGTSERHGARIDVDGQELAMIMPVASERGELAVGIGVYVNSNEPDPEKAVAVCLLPDPRIGNTMDWTALSTVIVAELERQSTERLRGAGIAKS